MLTISAWCVPCFAAAAAGLYAWWRKKGATSVVLQVIGAFAAALMVPGGVVVAGVLGQLRASSDVVHASRLMVSFVEWGALVVFVVGYCWEKFGRKG